MAGIRHNFVSAKIDKADTSKVRATEWNDDHVIDPGAILASDVTYKDGETVHEILDDTLNEGILDAITVTDDGGLNISWTAGEIYTPVGDIVETDSGSGSVTNGATTYLYWVSGTALTLSTTPHTSGVHVEIAHVHAEDNDIIGHIHHELIASVVIHGMSEAFADIFKVVVTDGLLISEHPGANAWDVDCSAGVYYHSGADKHTISAIDSTVTDIVRWFHSGGAWTKDANSQIDITQYDNGTNLAAVTASQFYRSLFIVDADENINWVYPTSGHVTLAGAINNTDPSVPPGLEDSPTLMAVIIRGNDAAFPTAGGDRWIDRRITLTTTPAGTVSDHGNLTGLADDDHTQYLLADGTRALAGAWDMGSQILTNVNIDSGDINTAVVNTEWDAAYTHSIDNSQAHTDYLINNGNDTATGDYTFDGSFIATGSSFPVFLVQRNTSETNTLRSAMGVGHITDQNMTDGFSAGFTLRIQDSAATWNTMGVVAGVRDGTDNTGAISISTYSGGTRVEDVVWIDPDRSVGFNTTDPQRLFHLHKIGTGATDSSFMQFTTGDTGMASGSVGAVFGYSASELITIWNYENSHMVFGNNNAHVMYMNSTGLRIANDATVPNASLDVDQYSATAAIPVLKLDQADVSEEFIEFAGGTIHTGKTGADEYIHVVTSSGVRYIKMYT